MAEEIVKLIQEAGVVGAGGAGFPTHVKVAAKAEYVIINGAECEPLLRVDQQLARAEAPRLLKALKDICKVTGAAKGIIALKGKYGEAIDELNRVNKRKRCETFILGDFYPAGDEQILVYEVLSRVVPEAGIPLRVGCVVSNVETLLNVADALEGRPVVDTYLTVTGEVPKPLTYKLPIGTSIRETLALTGAKDLSKLAVIEGGPMMGRLVNDLDSVITKTTKGLIVLPDKHPLVIRKTRSLSQELKLSKTACVQCMRCTDVCPRHLLGHSIAPHKIMRSLNYMKNDISALKTALICSECGACEYACMMGLSPRRINGTLKQELLKAGIKYESLRNQFEAIGVRDYRKIPVKRLINWLELTNYNQPAPLTDFEFVPKEVRIPLKQHVGAPGVPVVTVGQQVNRGDLLAGIPENSLGAKIHASITGKITEVNSHVVITRS